MRILLLRIVFWDVLPCKITVKPTASIIRDDSYFTRQYIPENNSDDGGNTHL
jgi:hypothetical protein